MGIQEEFLIKSGDIIVRLQNINQISLLLKEFHFYVFV